jgi:hypothetical protein
MLLSPLAAADIWGGADMQVLMVVVDEGGLGLGADGKPPARSCLFGRLGRKAMVFLKTLHWNRHVPPATMLA